MTRASDLAKLLGAGATINDGTTITTADNTDQLTLISTDTDANVGPVLNLSRDNSSAADNDLVGEVQFNADDDGNNQTTFGKILTVIEDASDGSEDGLMQIHTNVGGTLRDRIKITSSELVLNEESIDSDFRVESNDDANMFFVDAGNNRIGVRKSAPDTAFHMGGGSDNHQMVLQGNTVQRLGLQLGTDSRVFLGAATGNHFRVSKQDAGALFDVDPSGNIILGQSGAGIYLGVTSATASNLLDDYEEGTFTLTVGGGSSSPSSTASITNCRYTKVGNMVHFQAMAESGLNNSGASGTIYFSGLPFASYGPYGIGNIMFNHILTFNSNNGGIFGLISGTIIYIYQNNSGASATSTNHQANQTNSAVYLEGTYRVNV